MRTSGGMSLYGPRVVRLPDGLTWGFSIGRPLRSRIDSFRTVPRYRRVSRMAGSGSVAVDMCNLILEKSCLGVGVSRLVREHKRKGASI